MDALSIVALTDALVALGALSTPAIVIVLIMVWRTQSDMQKISAKLDKRVLVLETLFKKYITPEDKT